MKLIPTILACAALASPSLAGDVIVVDGQGGGDFTRIQDAYAAAADGDTIFVDSAPAFSNAVTLSGKGVSLVFDADVGPLRSSLNIDSIAAPSRFVLRGLELDRERLIRVRDCTGSVFIERASTPQGFSFLTIGDPFLFENCASVIVRQSVFSALMYDQGLPSTISYPVVEVRSSTVTFEDCTLEGRQGEGGMDPGGLCMSCCYGGFPGGVGIDVLGTSYVRAVNSTIVGGIGGFYGGFNNCVPGIDSPPARIDATSTLDAIGCTFIEPVPIEGTVNIIPEIPRSAYAPASVAAGQGFSIALSGANGDTAFVFAGGELVSRLRPAGEGFFHVIGVGRRRLGSLPSIGARTVTLTAPPIADPGTVLSLPLQVVYLLPTGQLRFSTATVLDIRGSGVPAW